MTEEENPILLQHNTMDKFGIYWPETHTIEFDIGTDTHTMHGDYLDQKWTKITQRQAIKTIQHEIDEVKNNIDELREKELTKEQSDELQRLENKLNARQNTLNVIQEVTEL